MKTLKYRMAAVFLVFLGAAGAPLFAYTASYVQDITTNGNTIATFRVYIKDNKLRIESNWMDNPQVMIRNESGYYNYLPNQNIAIQIPPSAQRRNLADDLPHYQEFLEKNQAQTVGTEIYENKEVGIYEYDDPNGFGRTRVWLWREKSFPLKIEVSGPQGTLTVKLTEVKIGQEINDNLFRLPEDVRIMTPEEFRPYGIPTQEEAR